MNHFRRIMIGFSLTNSDIDLASLRQLVLDPAAGGYCSFEGWVRNHHQGRQVERLEYEAYLSLAESEGTRILGEAIKRFDLMHAVCTHRTGPLEIGGLAVVVCVSSVHRDAAFEGCRYIIDELKSRVPIWKKEFFADGSSGWVRCDHCAGHHQH